MYWVHNIPIELRSLVQTLDFHQILTVERSRSESSREKQAFDVMYNAAWMIYCTKLFPRVRIIVMNDLPRLPYIILNEAEGKDPAGLMDTRVPVSNTSIRIAPFLSDSIANEPISNELLSHAASAEEPLSPALLEGPPRHLVSSRPLFFSANGPAPYAFMAKINFSNLIYLDLSYTKETAQLGLCCSFNQCLRVLKLRGCRMTDRDLAKWMPAGNKIWCLDVRDNLLTDGAIFDLPMLLRVQPPKQTDDERSDDHLYEDVPQYQRDEDRDGLSSIVPLRLYEGEEFINCMEKDANFSAAMDQVLDISDPLIRETGLTHLFIDGNKLSSHGVKVLLTSTNRIQHLDVGTVEASNSRKFYVPYTTVFAQLNSRSAAGLSRKYGSRMERLRIHHSIVTFVPTLINHGSRNEGFSLPLVKQAEDFGRYQRLIYRMKEPKQLSFSPLRNYRVSELALTGIPTKSYGYTIERLIELLNDCIAQEVALNEARKPPRNRRSPQLLPGLRKLILEFIPQDNSAQSPSGGSVSGDRDADNFLTSSEGDFSFFGQETMSSVSRRGSVATSTSGTIGGPVGRKGSVTGNPALSRQLSGLSITSRPGSSGSQPPAYTSEVMDVVLELKKWRALNLGKWTGNLVLKFPS